MSKFTDNDVKQWSILVVDDDYQSANMVKQVMDFYGAKVEIATNGPEALKLMQWFKPTMVLLDLQMPDMNGYEVKDVIHKIFPNAPFPIIAHTATVTEAETPSLLKQGFDGYILKPIDVDGIVRTLQQILERKRFSRSE
ncbi:MAG: response regulator [Chloroflexi bacterium]|nr:response regulator [Chloroflexota bacterium]